MSEWEEQSKYQAAVKHLAQYIAYLEGVHFAVDIRYWDLARAIVDELKEHENI